MNYLLNGNTFALMLEGGASVLSANETRLNDLNVFPVADGDTGSNMLRTVLGGLNDIKNNKSESISSLLSTFAKGTLLFARGNSGVILSQIFSGIASALSEVSEVNVANLARAYQNAIKTSYSAVQNPTEGTILTVFRESTEYAISKINENSSLEDFYEYHVEGAKKSLENTKNLLPVLAEANVVDSGGAGYLCIASGMCEVLLGKRLSLNVEEFAVTQTQSVNIDSFTRDSVLEFGYCTEFMLRLTTAKVNPDTFDLQTVLNDLNAFNGESVVAYKTADIIKVHVHTFTPGAILAKMQEYGEFLTVKVENMSLGHSETPKNINLKSETLTPPAVKKYFSVVTVCTGEGMSELFKKMGADFIVSGGQSFNPSVKDFLNVFEKCESEYVIVLPNNKNVILAAEMASSMFDKANVRVIQSKNLMQGYGALSVINPGIKDIDAIVKSANRAIADIKCGEITQAVRNANLNGVCVEKGQFVAISNGKMSDGAPTAEQAVLNLIKSFDTDLCEIITLFKGKSINSQECDKLVDELSEIYPDLEIQVYDGGQEVYDYLVAVE